MQNYLNKCIKKNYGYCFNKLTGFQNEITYYFTVIIQMSTIPPDNIQVLTFCQKGFQIEFNYQVDGILSF